MTATALPIPRRRPSDLDPLVPLIGPADAPLLVRDLYAGGDPGPIVAALAHVPELCEMTLPFVGAALGPSAVSLRDKEIAVLRTSANLGCTYCVNAHTVVAADSGLSHDEVRALRSEARVDHAFPDASDRALIDWIDALTAGPGPVDTEVAASARAALGDHRLVELTVTVGATWMLNRLATGLRLPTAAETFLKLRELGFAEAPQQPDIDHVTEEHSEGRPS
jgi:AhpD family alkylhydroperoxidase